MVGGRMADHNIAVARRWFEEVWNLRREATIDELLASDSVCLADGESVRGTGEFRDRMFTPFLAAFPDLRVVVEAVIGQGDEVAVRWTAHGTHTGPGLGCSPTGDAVTFRGLTWVSVRGGKLMSGWQSSNIPAVLAALAGKSAQ